MAACMATDLGFFSLVLVIFVAPISLTTLRVVVIRHVVTSTSGAFADEMAVVLGRRRDDLFVLAGLQAWRHSRAEAGWFFGHRSTHWINSSTSVNTGRPICSIRAFSRLLPDDRSHPGAIIAQ